jgi:hypothetical protein
MPSQPSWQACANTTVAGLVDMLAELQAGAGAPQKAGELGLAYLDRLAHERAAVDLEEIEGDQMRLRLDPVAVSQEVEQRQPAFIADHQFAVDQARFHLEQLERLSAQR